MALYKSIYLLTYLLTLHQIHVAVYKYRGRATCIRIQVDTYRCDDNFVADTGYIHKHKYIYLVLQPGAGLKNSDKMKDSIRRRQAIQMNTSGCNLYPGYMCQV